MCRLGCASNYRVVFGDRCGGHVTCSMEDDVSDIEYARVLDDTSEATIAVNIGGGVDRSCCECLADIRSWVRTMAIYRDGDLVWGPGPVVNSLIGVTKASIKAWDVTGWLNRRVVRTNLTFKQVDIVDIAVALIEQGMAPDDPCGIVDLMHVTRGGVLIDKTYEAGRTYVGDALRDLAKIGLDFTVVGATIVLAPNLTFGPFATLQDDDFLDEVQVEERGEEAATKWYVNGESISGSAGGEDPYCGLIEQIASDADNVEDNAAANSEAANRLIASNPAPMYVVIPDGARLSPNAPVCFDQLVPGTLVDINLQQLCRPVVMRNRLTAVKVSVNSEGESVQITLSPPGTTASEGGGD